MSIYLFKIGCWSEEDAESLKKDGLKVLMNNPDNKGSWHSIFTESDDFDMYDISFDKMSIHPANSSEDFKCSYDDSEEQYIFLIALKTEEILCHPGLVSQMIAGTSFENLYLLYPAVIDDEETVCYEQWVDGEWDEGYFIGGKDMSCVGEEAGEVLGISTEDFINPENYT
ncbi:hypothetical protein N8880_04230 [Gammaproteobacteria bacterium]|nr:hypothetical protein [Gammaproteobacteria bacterium]